ncbi:BACON domain-containing protein [Porphyromonas macacae]|uniref:BACON domain-containing protein n=1 Tax=Porphyromonas macacae TaxID=28115 RepID=UPI0009E0442A|nr:BACON domain-containing protein [Porphyromonas macacae]
MRQFCLLLMLLSLMLFSCHKEEEHMLVVSPDSQVTFTSGKSEAKLTVTTNAGSWEAISNVEWLRAVKSGNELILLADSNSEVQPRIAQVTVISGTLAEILQVKQEGAAASISIEGKEELRIERYGGKVSLYVQTNAPEWEVLSDVSWIKVSKPSYGNEITLDISENETGEERQTELTMKAGNVTKMFKVSQDGPMRFIMPFFEWGANIREIDKLEKGRHSKLVDTPKPPSFGIDDTPFYTYNTESTVFPYVRYTTMRYSAEFVYVATMVAKEKDIFSDAGYLEFLKENGFVKQFSGKGGVLYLNKEKRVKVLLTKDAAQTPLAVFMPVPEETEPYPTLDRFIYGLTDFNKAKADDVRNWEEKNGGEYSDKFSSVGLPGAKTDLLMFHAPRPLGMRGYTIDRESGLLKRTTFTFLSLELGMYMYGNLHVLTGQFVALLEKEGFVPFDENAFEGEFSFVNIQKKLFLLVRKSLWENRYVLSYNIALYTPSGTQACMDKNINDAEMLK